MMSATTASPGLAAVEKPEAASHHAPALVRGLLALRQRIGLYPAGHPQIADKVAELEAHVRRELSRTGELQIDFVDGAVLVDGEQVPQDPTTNQALHELTDLGIHSIRFSAGVNADELLAAAHFLREYGDEPGGHEPVEARLARRGVEHIAFTRIVPLDTRWYARQWPDHPQGQLDPDYEQALLVAQCVFDDVKSGRELDRVTVRDLVQFVMQRVARSNAAVGQILAMKQFENLTYVHSVNVSMLSLLIGGRIGLDETDTAALVEAALLHDIGKTRIPLDILRKPAALTTHERRVIELHVTYGGEILAGSDGFGPLAATVALEHHRTPRGSGYPDLGDGVVPHAMSQVVSVADVYEAVTGARTYRDPIPPERACLLLARIAGDQLNAALVKAFVNTVTFFPIGSFVRTSRDEIGMVVRTNDADPLHPVIAVLEPGLQAVREVVDTSRRSSDGGIERHVLETLVAPEGAPDLAQVMAEAGRTAQAR